MSTARLVKKLFCTVHSSTSALMYPYKIASEHSVQCPKLALGAEKKQQVSASQQICSATSETGITATQHISGMLELSGVSHRKPKKQQRKHKQVQTNVEKSRGPPRSVEAPFQVCYELACKGDAAAAQQLLIDALRVTGKRPSKEDIAALTERPVSAGDSKLNPFCAQPAQKEAAYLKQGLQLTVDHMLRDPRLKQAFLRQSAMILALQALSSSGATDLTEKLIIRHRMIAEAGRSQVLGNVILNALAKDTGLAFHRLAEMEAEGFQPNLISFNTLLKSCMNTRSTGRASEVSHLLRQRGLQGDEYTYHTLIKLYSYAGDPLKALQVKEEMLAAGVIPSAVIWGSLIVMCGQRGFLEKAFSLWADMQALGIAAGTDSYHALMNACAASYQGERALGLLQDMERRGVPRTRQTFNIAIKACSSAPGVTLSKQQLDLGFELLGIMESSGLHPDAITYTGLFVLCTQAKAGKLAWKAYKEASQAGVRQDVQMCTALITALGTEGLAHEALSVFRKMVWGPARLKPTEKTFRLVAKVCRENGLLEQALQVYKGMRSQGFKPSSLEFQELTQACAEQALKEGTRTTLPAKMVEILGISHKFTIDLHRLSEAEARASVLCALLSLQNAYHNEAVLQNDLHIITGVGLHTAGQNGPKLRKAILRLLSNELRIIKWPQEEDTTHDEFGKATETENRSVKNLGRVVIPRAQLQAWLDLRRK